MDEEIRKLWKTFLSFGVFILIVSTVISAVVSTYTSNKIAEGLAGPPCRIELPTDRFETSRQQQFNLGFRITNYKGENLFLEQVASYCVWQEQMEQKEKENVEETDLPIIKLPTATELSPPQEQPYIPAYGSKPWISSCLSPAELGEYNIKIFVRTNKGSCESNIIMVVKENETV